MVDLKEINQLLKNIPDGYYIEEITTQIVHGEIVNKATYKPKYELHSTEFQWISPGNQYSKPTTRQLEELLTNLQDGSEWHDGVKRRVEIVKILKESTNNHESGYEGVIERDFNELLTVVYKTYKY